MSNQQLFKVINIFSFIFLLLIASNLYSQDYGVASVNDSHKILPERERAKVMNEWLRWRLDNIIPKLMRREGIDMWLIINREYNEDPVYMSLVPEPTMSARRMSILIFYDRGEKIGVERLSGGYYGIGDLYKATWIDKKKKQFESLAKVIKERNPKKIGINEVKPGSCNSYVVHITVRNTSKLIVVFYHAAAVLSFTVHNHSLIIASCSIIRVSKTG